MSSSLTEEQRRRIEENRRKALELRQNKQAAATLTNTRPISAVANLASMSTTSSSNAKPATHPSNYQNPTYSQTPGNGASTSTGASQSAPSSRPTSAPVPPVKSPPKFLPNKVISGSATLISKDRFKIDMPYHAQAIATFKTVVGAQYDPTTKTWNFPLAQHQQLLTSMEYLKPHILIGGLPSHVLKIFKNSNQSSSSQEPDLSRIDPVLLRALMPFQKEGVIFGIRKQGRVLIADDMGLGKTIQALGIAHYYRNEWPLLIVAPSSMRYRWRESIWEWLPSVSPGSIFIMESSRDDFSSNVVVILSYDFLQKKRDELSQFKVVIIDESHHLKNIKTARAKAAVPILHECKRAILLSGTPALSKPIELFTQISAINRNLFNVNTYGTRYCAGKKNTWGWDYNGSSNMAELYLILEESLMIRRLKSEVLQQLPPKLRKLVVLDPTLLKLNSTGFKARALAFHESKGSKTSKFNEAEKRKRLLEYYSESAKVKLPAVSAYIADLLEGGRKFLVFAHHKTMIAGICSDLETAEVKYILIDGSTTSEDRQYCVEQFQSNSTIRVAVLSIMAANSGITLTAAGLVVFAELYWNPGILTQAEDRAHRIGQEDSVVVDYLLARGTSDDFLWPMVQEKLNVLNKAGLSKDDFKDAEAIDFGKDLDLNLIPASQGSNASQSRSQQKGIQNYFTKAEEEMVKTKPPSAPSTDADQENNVFDMSAEDDAILMQMISDHCP